MPKKVALTFIGRYTNGSIVGRFGHVEQPKKDRRAKKNGPKFYNTCLSILRERGFDLHVEGELTEEGLFPTDHIWVATKGVFRLCADNPIELLGLAAIHEYKNPTINEPYWWSVGGEDILDELYEAAWGLVDDDE